VTLAGLMARLVHERLSLTVFAPLEPVERALRVALPHADALALQIDISFDHVAMLGQKG
jgi:hypothetical protein